MALPSDRATRASHEAPAGLHHSAGITSAAQDAAEREAAKREKHKPKSLVHKRWRAIHNPVKGWHAALVDDPIHTEFAARMNARNALLRGDMEAFRDHAADALLARCASVIEAAAAGETSKTGSTEGESAVAESETPKANPHDHPKPQDIGS